MTVIQIIRRILRAPLWVLTVFLTVAAFAFLPGPAGFLALLLIAVVIPLEEWQAALGKYTRRFLRPLAAIAIAAALFFSAGTPLSDLLGGDLLSSGTQSAATGQSTAVSGGSAQSAPSPAVTPAPSVPAQNAAQSTATNTPQAPAQSTASTGFTVVVGKPSQSFTDAPSESVSAESTVSPNASANTAPDPSDPLSSAAGDTQSSAGSAEGPLVWIPTRGGVKYHNDPTCSDMIEPLQVTVATALNRGFDACKKCYN